MREGWEDITSKVERVEMLEDHMGMRLSGIEAYFSAREHRILLVGEARSDNGFDMNTDRQFIVCVAAYDGLGRVVSRNFADWRCNEFSGSDKFGLEIRVPVDVIGKVRIYPRWA